MSKFKVGDTIQFRKDYWKGGLIDTVIGFDPENDPITQNSGAFYEHCLADIADVINRPINNTTIMSKVTTFIKNSLLSKEEKLLRKHGLKTECGEYTSEAKEAILNALCEEKKADLVKIAEGLEAEEKESK